MVTQADNEPRTRLIMGMMRQNGPQNIYRIAQNTGLAVKHADYWVHKLIDDGVALCVEEGGGRLYFLQPIFYDPQFAKNFDAVFDRMHKLINSKLELIQGDNKESAVFNIMFSILQVIRRQRRI